ncbi:FadR/GntR family transcriptional regulator [Rubritalea tangerina]|uniref:FadR/GntR family transcriptional regulator n=1 Tax=Rubritalea tangerina TaxID=430798 RepID=A0ABW4Z9R4_9BACT
MMKGSRYHQQPSAHASPVPTVYKAELVVAELKKRINEANWSEYLPSERKLSADLGVSRPILRDALAILEAENWIARHPNGRPVIHKTKQNKLTHLTP